MSWTQTKTLLIGTGLLLALVGCKTKDGDDAMQRPALSPARARFLLADVNEAQRLLDQGGTTRKTVVAVKAAYAQLKRDYAELADFDLGLWAKAETYLARRKRARAVKRYTKLTDDYPQSELVDVCHQRLYEIGHFYLQGPVIANLLLFKVRGYSRGIKVLEDLSEEVGLEDPNGYGVRATVEIAQNLESRRKYQDAYLKWLELSAEWDEGPLRQQALLGMARTKLAAYKLPPRNRWVLYNGENLTNAREYYAQFAQEYPEDAQELRIAEILAEIDELMAAKQLTIARYYTRVGKSRSAHLYLDMVATNWPDTEAARTARDLLDEGEVHP